MLDLDVTPSALFVKDDPPPLADGEEAAADEPAEDENFIQIDWLCKPGLPARIDLIKKEFEKERRLRPIKVIVKGPPCAGKSFYSQQLAEHYNVPHIHMSRLIEEILAWDQEKEDRYAFKVLERDAKVAELLNERAQSKEAK